MSSHFFRSVLLLTLSLLFSPLSDLKVNARWAEKSEANLECLKEKTVYKVKQDGSWTRESELQLKILTEAGRQALSTQCYTYDATNSTLKILEAKTISEGKEVIVPKEKIEDKPLASDPSGLRKNHQILVPFEQVTIGSIVHVKLIQTCFKPQFEKHFSTAFRFGIDYVLNNSEIIIESELPFFSKINDPRNSLNVVESNDGSKYILTINLKKPIFETLVGESDNSYGEPVLYTSLSISTEKTHERLGKLTAKLYQPLLTAPLPTKLESIRQAASTITDEKDRIDTVVTHLIEKITYLGSWDTLEGHMAPRSLETIINSGYGDCKEYSACLAAVLNKLGYQAKIALINRNDVYLEGDALPSFHEFNHAIVKVIGPSGKTYWIDPTNSVSMADGIFPDIADRPVEVLDPENPTYERTPPIDARHAVINYEQIISISENGYVHREGSYACEGEAAKSLTEFLNTHTPSLVEEYLLQSMCHSDDPIKPILNLTKINSRTVKPVKATFSYGENHIMTHTNHGDAFPLASNWYKPYTGTSQKNEGALYVGHPEATVRKHIFKNVSAEDLSKLAFSIQTPWLNVKRELFVTEEGIVVTETIEKLKSIISAKDLKSEEFEKLKNTLRKYCDGVAIIFSK
jgi:hypothetical protein